MVLASIDYWFYLRQQKLVSYVVYPSGTLEIVKEAAMVGAPHECDDHEHHSEEHASTSA